MGLPPCFSPAPTVKISPMISQKHHYVKYSYSSINIKTRRVIFHQVATPLRHTGKRLPGGVLTVYRECIWTRAYDAPPLRKLAPRHRVFTVFSPGRNPGLHPGENNHEPPLEIGPSGSCSIQLRSRLEIWVTGCFANSETLSHITAQDTICGVSMCTECTLTVHRCLCFRCTSAPFWRISQLISNLEISITKYHEPHTKFRPVGGCRRDVRSMSKLRFTISPKT